MAKQVTLHIADTPISGTSPITTLSPTLPAINWPVDWSKTRNNAGEARLSYKPAPFDAPQTFRFQVEKIADIYNGSAVDRNFQLPYKRGMRILCQLNLVASVTDSEDPTYRVDLPIDASVLIKAPMSGLLSVGNIRSVVERCYSGLYETGVVDDSRLTELLKESMLPEGL